MEEGKKERTTGRFQRSAASRPGRCWVMIVVLLLWDGVLLYMIGAGLIAPVYGAGFVILLSVYLGYQL